MNDVPKIFDKVPFDIQREVAQKEMPNKELPFLRATTIRENCELVGFEPEAISYVQSVASQISTVPDLKYLLWYCHCLLCHSSSYSRADVCNWMSLTNLLGELAGAFYLLVTLSGIPEAKKTIRSVEFQRKYCKTLTVIPEFGPMITKTNTTLGELI